MLEATFNVGIDIGSTTIKLVILDQARHIIYKHYTRHFSEIGAALHRDLKALRDVVGGAPFSFALTGSAAMGIAQRVGLPFVQEVIACASAVRSLIPQTDTVVELGGEDAKITYFGATTEQRMNGVCAGGTGSFIDHMASLLSTDAAGINELAKKGKQIYSIASRCGVFAKTDIQALMNDGVSKADIALSIFQAVVNQTIANLAQGRPINGKVAFLGGPLCFLSALKDRFIKTLGLTKDELVEVDDGCYFVALGAALSQETETLDCDRLSETIECTGREISAHERAADVHLFTDADDYEKFRARHAAHRVPRASLADYTGPVFVGIDAGSTTAKLAVIGKDRQLLYTDYGSNQGSPLATVVAEMKKLYEQLRPDQPIAAVLTTGYGEDIVKAAIHADAGEVETIAHLRAAQEFCPDVSFVLDIGGQDMKCFFVRGGNIGNITLNEACSAGCGSFIENFAQGLNITAAEFAALAVHSQAPVDLGTRCTVFMNSRVKQAQKEGADVADISAGIAISVIKNALFKVMQLRDVSSLGDNIVVQGGTFYNDAVLRAMEAILGRPVIRPDIAGLMGAYGAAILALESGVEKSTVLPAQALRDFRVETGAYRCGRCGNNCLITVQKFPDGGKFFTGNRCERGIGGERKSEDATPNLYAYKYRRLFDHYKPLADAPRGDIGLPRVLNMYEDYPFWFTFFTRLGYRVLISGESSAALYYRGLATIPSDSLCYPAKLAHGHIMDLVERGIKKIFYPCIPYNVRDSVHAEDNNFNCPVVASYAENIRANMDVLRERGVTFWQPFLPLNNPHGMLKRLTEELSAEHIGKSEIAAAIKDAYAELERYKEDVRAYGAKVLAAIERDHRPAILLVGRPYHVDPEINHGIPEMIRAYDLPVLDQDSVYHLPVTGGALSVVNQWSYHARLYHAARFAVEHDNITLIQFSSFGCGLDAITTGQVQSILEEQGRIYTMIKLDEISNLGSAKIRLRSLLAALSRHQQAAAVPIPVIDRPRFTAQCRETDTIIMPQMAPIQFDLISTVFNKHGYRTKVVDTPRDAALNLGLRYVNNDMCYPAIVVIGQVMAQLKGGDIDPNHAAVMMFQTCGACRATNYMSIMRQALKNAGLGQVPVFACWGMAEETDAFRLRPGTFVDAVKAIVYGDVLMQLKNRVLPYEQEPGSTQRLYEKWLQLVKAELQNGNLRHYEQNIAAMVREFDELPIREDVAKPRVGVVGEILVKYHPIANNDLENVLLAEGAEVVVPALFDFVMYLAYDNIVKYDLLAGKYLAKVGSQIFIRFLEYWRKPAVKALAASRRFKAPHSVETIAALARKQVSLGNLAGEGWFLTGEMMQLMEDGVNNIICLQPFACLPNHITGKGMMHQLREKYPKSNVIALDCDAGATEVNQLNRIKLMLAVARENCAPKKLSKMG